MSSTVTEKEIEIRHKSVKEKIKQIKVAAYKGKPLPKDARCAEKYLYTISRALYILYLTKKLDEKATGEKFVEAEDFYRLLLWQEEWRSDEQKIYDRIDKVYKGIEPACKQCRQTKHIINGLDPDKIYEPEETAKQSLQDTEGFEESREKK